MYVVVCYDVIDDRRRAKLHELLLGYGNPVQKSVFECQLSPAQIQTLQSRAKRYVRGHGESLRFYQLCRQCQARTWAEGTRLTEAEDERDYAV